jgi:hypothetical protein
LAGVDVSEIGSNMNIKLLAVKLTQFSTNAVFLDSAQVQILYASISLVETTLTEIGQEIKVKTTIFSKGENDLLKNVLSKVSSVASILETLLSSLTITSNATISIQLSEEIVSQFSTLSEIIFASGKKSLNIYVCHPLKFF